MAEQKVIWSSLAEAQLNNTLSFYEQRNGNPDFSLKLLDEIELHIQSLLAHKQIGRLTTNKATRVLAFRTFALFYELNAGRIEIVAFWDFRQDPQKNKIK